MLAGGVVTGVVSCWLALDVDGVARAVDVPLFLELVLVLFPVEIIMSSY